MTGEGVPIPTIYDVEQGVTAPRWVRLQILPQVGMQESHFCYDTSLFVILKREICKLFTSRPDHELTTRLPATPPTSPPSSPRNRHASTKHHLREAKRFDCVVVL